MARIFLPWIRHLTTECMSPTPSIRDAFPPRVYRTWFLPSFVRFLQIHIYIKSGGVRHSTPVAIVPACARPCPPVPARARPCPPLPAPHCPDTDLIFPARSFLACSAGVFPSDHIGFDRVRTCPHVSARARTCTSLPARAGPALPRRDAHCGCSRGASAIVPMLSLAS